ncbi:putative type VI secretion system effector [Rugamonas rivuli]|uniref:Uncharacterized protein n=1 Tax=Rugamonas rivuli TaxID=2743358 RepID=A0A843SKV7_9BURK|nr:putative type VI secretion system effector [Rugamonas rivuli]MQA22813.1 hypothetical protein [Rugamonas rivuli]
MTDFLPHPAPLGLIKLTGKISDYKVVRESASFVFTKNDQSKLGVVAIAASLVGMGGQAISMASNTTSMEENADHIQFKLNDKILKGWLWRSPFRDGDEVEVAAEWQTDHYEIFGVTRPNDKTIALYPHCSRSISLHIKNAIKWWLIISIGLQIGISILFGTNGWQELRDFWVGAIDQGGGWFVAGITVFIAIAIWSMTKQWMPFAKLAEKVFTTLDLPNPRNIDLVKSSRNQRKNQDNVEFGSMYFRY